MRVKYTHTLHQVEAPNGKVHSIESLTIHADLSRLSHEQQQQLISSIYDAYATHRVRIISRGVYIGDYYPLTEEFFYPDEVFSITESVKVK